MRAFEIKATVTSEGELTECPEGAKACSPGLALFASPGSTPHLTSKSPEGAAASHRPRTS